MSLVDLADIEHVEVASGPNSLLFGTGAAGGLVNLATKHASVNLRNKLASRGYLDNAEGAKHLLSPAQMPYNFSFSGPGARYTSDFRNTVIRLEQKVGSSLVLEAAYQPTDRKLDFQGDRIREGFSRTILQTNSKSNM